MVFIQKAFTEASTILQQKMKFRKVYIRCKQDEISNKNKNKKIFFFKRAYHPKSLPNKTLQAAYYNMLDHINLFDKMIVYNKRHKNIRDALMPSSLK